MGALAWYFGIGGFDAEIESDDIAFDGVSGGSVHAVGGVAINPHFALEASLATFDFKTTQTTPNGNYPPDDANYGYFAFGMKLNFLDISQHRVSPWVGLNFTAHDIGLSNYVYSYSGNCIDLAFGADVRLVDWLHLRAGKHHCSSNSTTDIYFGERGAKLESTTYALDLVYYHRFKNRREPPRNSLAISLE